MVSSTYLRQRMSGKVVRSIPAATMACYQTLSKLLCVDYDMLLLAQDMAQSISKVAINEDFHTWLFYECTMNIRFPVKHQVCNSGGAVK
ncbi:hypothetical protein NPIL_695701 [Nephila pilipes]|uniref:Uncharacterized protein n=1 Tax=Nephila pilipes TaxID=299642 RepID=A0A8X6PRC3_NEPPI|nr:hypothetical protein NPIL_695701 [Nephila pilipes]